MKHRFKPGDSVWVDEGDSPGCAEYSGIVETVDADGTLAIRVTSIPIVAGAATGSLRHAHPDTVDVTSYDPGEV